MIKNYFKNNPIHKDIVKNFDFIFTCQPTLFFIVWILICFGMYSVSFVNNESPMFITTISYKTIFLFIGITKLVALLSFNYNLKSKENKIIKEDYVIMFNKYRNISIIISFVFIFLSGWYLMFLVGLIFLSAFKLDEESDSYLKMFVFCVIALLLILLGVFHQHETTNFFVDIFQIKLLIAITPYWLVVCCIIFLKQVFENNIDISDNMFDKFSIKILVFIPFSVTIISLLLSLYVNDPLSSTSIIVFIGFYLYGLFRSKNKDFIRLIRYPTGILNFFVITIYPYLFFPVFILFYFSKYYYWHRMDLHYPTFLVSDND